MSVELFHRELSSAAPIGADAVEPVNMASLAQIEDEWRALEKHAAYFCQFFVYARLALSVAEAQGKPAFLITIRDNGALRGVWGLTLTRGFHSVLRPFSCGTNEEFSWPLVDDPTLAERILRQAATLRGLADRLMIYNAPKDSPLDRAAAALPFKQAVQHLQGYVIKASRFKNWRDVEAEISDALLYQIRRDVRRGEKEGKYSVGWCDTVDDATKALEFYFAQKKDWLAAKGKKSLYLLKPEVPDFFARLIREADLTATPLVVAAKLNGEPIAAGICCVSPTTVEYVMTTFDPRYSRISPGKLLIRFLAEYAISRGKNFDFAITLADYKARWPVDVRDYRTRTVMLTRFGQIPEPAALVKQVRGRLGVLKRRIRGPASTTAAPVGR